LHKQFIGYLKKIVETEEEEELIHAVYATTEGDSIYLIYKYL